MPELVARLVIRSWDKSIEDMVTGTIYRALSADAKTKHGFSATAVIGDEVAQWPSRELWDVLTTSGGAREHPLALAISTQAPSDSHFFSELLDYGAMVNVGTVEDPHFRCWLWAAPEDADIWDEAVWQDCNPGWGTIRDPVDMSTTAHQAKRLPSRQAAFQNLYLNQRVAAEASFLPVTEWQACAADVDPERLRGRRCFVGLDLASVADLCAMALYFPDGGEVQCWACGPGSACAPTSASRGRRGSRAAGCSSPARR